MPEKIDVIQSVTDVKNYLHDLQDRICSILETDDGNAKFIEDCWKHQEGGGGRTRYLTEGKIFEKAGVNFSHVHGMRLPPAATAKRPELVDCIFQALGVSVIIHPL